MVKKWNICVFFFFLAKSLEKSIPQVKPVKVNAFHRPVSASFDAYNFGQAFRKNSAIKPPIYRQTPQMLPPSWTEYLPFYERI